MQTVAMLTQILVSYCGFDPTCVQRVEEEEERARCNPYDVMAFKRLFFFALKYCNFIAAVAKEAASNFINTKLRKGEKCTVVTLPCSLWCKTWLPPPL